MLLIFCKTILFFGQNKKEFYICNRFYKKHNVKYLKTVRYLPEIIDLHSTFRAISSVGSEHLVYTQGVGGSTPSSPTHYLLMLKFSGRLAQLVQSTWFTPKGSGVRLPHRPQRKVFF